MALARSGGGWGSPLEISEAYSKFKKKTILEGLLLKRGKAEWPPMQLRIYCTPWSLNCK